MNHNIFSKKYFFITLPSVQAFSPGIFSEMFQENFWGTCDLLISQRVKKDNRFSTAVATQNLPARLPEDTKIIWIPNIYFTGYFPQLQNARNLRVEDPETYEYFRLPDKYVDAFMTGGGEEVLRNWKNFCARRNLFLRTR